MDLEKDTLTLESPATEWRDAWPTGNGIAGALIFGNVQNETIILNHESCWLYGSIQELPDISSSLKTVRELICSKEYLTAHNYYRDRLNADGYSPQMSSFSPVGTLKLIHHGQIDAVDYRRSLNMKTGEVTVTWRQGSNRFSRKIFASRDNGRICYQIASTGKADLNLNIGLSALDGNATQSWLDTKGLHFNSKTEESRLEIRGREDSGRHFGIVAHINAVGGESGIEDGSVRITCANEIQIELTVLADARADDFTIPKSGVSYRKALEKHQLIHQELYDRVQLKLHSEATQSVQTMFDYGRYLMISGSGGKLPPNLQGLWNGDILPIWNCFYMLNENIQMMHWQALPGSLPEFLFPMFDYYETRIDNFRENARKLFGCRGIFIPANTVPDTGLITDLQGHLIYWIAGAAWLARFYFDYYLYTDDIEFLENRAMPLMRETALFYEDYLYENRQGKLEFCPSISPENAPEEFNHDYKMDANCNVTINATMDVALCKELLTNLIKASRICNPGNPEISIWEEMERKLPDYNTNSDGAIREWLHKGFSDNYHHRHQSHIYPFFPGSEIQRGDELIPAIERAVEKRLSVGLKEQTGWSVVHLANIYARLGLGDRALECLRILQDYCTGENLFTYHNDWREQGVCEAKPRHFDKRVFQIDANLGYPAAIMEMLVYSTPGQISLLPGLPSDLKEGQISGLKCRGSIGLTVKWAPGEISFILTSEKEQRVALSFPAALKALTLNNAAYNRPLNDVLLDLFPDEPLTCRAELVIS